MKEDGVRTIARAARSVPPCLCGILLLLSSAYAQMPGDARRGAQVFRERHCIECHSFRGVGGTIAPDLGRRSAREYTPSRLAGVMWNHAPAMWRTMSQKGLAIPELDQQNVADLYAYFFSVRYFGVPGDAARGKALFASKHCAECHALRGERKVGPTVADWKAVSDPIAWVREMWNHADAMFQQMEKRGVPWPNLTEQDLTDLLVYLQNLPETRSSQAEFTPADPREGQALFQQKGCANCHTLGAREAGKINLLAAGPPWRSMVEFAVLMWDHAPQMHGRGRISNISVPTFAGEEMNHLIGYLFQSGFFEEKGDARRGRRAFVRKKCASCHEQKLVASAPSSASPAPAGLQAPDLKQFRGQVSSIWITSALWKHGPKMLEAIEQQGRRWPQFSGTEMADLIAYLNRRP